MFSSHLRDAVGVVIDECQSMTLINSLGKAWFAFKEGPQDYNRQLRHASCHMVVPRHKPLLSMPFFVAKSGQPFCDPSGFRGSSEILRYACEVPLSGATTDPHPTDTQAQNSTTAACCGGWELPYEYRADCRQDA